MAEASNWAPPPHTRLFHGSICGLEVVESKIAGLHNSNLSSCQTKGLPMFQCASLRYTFTEETRKNL